MKALIYTSLGLLAAAGCAPPPDTTPPTPDPIHINSRTTGSITIPSVCERPAVDARVTTSGIDSFAVVWAGDRYEVVYVSLDKHSIVALQLDPNGQPLGSPAQIDQTANAAALPNLIALPTGYAVAWEETIDTQDTSMSAMVRTHALDAMGQPTGTSQTIAFGRPRQMRPVLSRSPFGTLVAWMDQSGSDIEGLTTVGDSFTSIAALDDTLAPRMDMPVQRIDPPSRVGYPWLAGDDTRVSLLWSEDGSGKTEPYLSPVTNTLAVSDRECVRDTTATNSALLGRLLLTDFGDIAAWEDNRSGEAEIYMSLVDTAGTMAFTGLVEEPDTGNANWPHMAYTGSSAGIVYYQYRSGRPQIFMTFIDPTGARVGGGADAQVSNTTAQAKYPDVVWTGSEFGVLWIDTRDNQQELYFNSAQCKLPAPI